MVLLSTYNGARHLRPQLDSIAAQSFGRWTLLWRDDGSTDETEAVLETFAREAASGRCRRISDGTEHMGITGSFLSLLRHVPEGHISAFADQDDVWLPDKLARGVAALASVPAGRPALYCARQRLVDDDLSPLGLSPHPGRPAAGFPAALTQNVATGCTVMLNPAAVALIAASDPPEGTLHDWWSYLLVSAAGGRLIADPVPVVLYRQHSGNAVGAPHSLLRRGVMALRRGPDAFMQLFRRHVAALQASPALAPDAMRTLHVLERALAGGPMARLRAMRQVRCLIRQTRLETLLFRLWFLIG